MNAASGINSGITQAGPKRPSPSSLDMAVGSPYVSRKEVDRQYRPSGYVSSQNLLLLDIIGKVAQSLIYRQSCFQTLDWKKGLFVQTRPPFALEPSVAHLCISQLLSTSCHFSARISDRMVLSFVFERSFCRLIYGTAKID